MIQTRSTKCQYSPAELDGCVVVFGVFSKQRPDPDAEQHDHSAGNVRPVKPGHREEAGGEQAHARPEMRGCTDPGRIMVEKHQLTIFIHLNAEENASDQDRWPRARPNPLPSCYLEMRTGDRTMVSDEQIRMNVLRAVRLMASGFVSSS